MSTSSAGPSPQFAARHAKYHRPARLSLKKPLPDPPASTYLYHHHHNHHHQTLPATVYSPEFDEPDRPATPTNISFFNDGDDSDDSSSSSAATSRAASPVRRARTQRSPSSPSTPMSPTSPKSEWSKFTTRPPPPNLIRRPSKKMKAVLGIGMTYPAASLRSSTPAAPRITTTRPQESHLPICDNWDATDSDSSSTATTTAPLPPLQPWQPLAPIKMGLALDIPLDVPPRPNSRWSDYSETGSTKESWRASVLQHLHLPVVRRPRSGGRAMSMVEVPTAAAAAAAGVGLEEQKGGAGRLKDVFGRLASGKEERRRRELKRKITVVGSGGGYF